MSIDLECPKCGNTRTYNGDATQVRCLKESGGCGSKININQKHIVIKVSQINKKTRTYPILNTDELRYIHKRLIGDSIRDKPQLIISSLIYNLMEIRSRKVYE